MSSVPKEIEASKGDSILPKWQALLAFIKNTGIVVGPGVKVTQGPNGTYVDAESNFRPWTHPFKVSTDGSTVRVRAGLVNGVAPYIGKVRITGVDDDGKKVEVPELDIKHDGTLITYVNLVLITPADGDIVIVDSPETIFIEHSTSVPKNFAGGGVTQSLGRAVYPLAALYWDEKNIFRQRFQIVHHNLGHRFIQSKPQEGIPGRHLFWAA